MASAHEVEAFRKLCLLEIPLSSPCTGYGDPYTERQGSCYSGKSGGGTVRSPPFERSRKNDCHL